MYPHRAVSWIAGTFSRRGSSGERPLPAKQLSAPVFAADRSTTGSSYSTIDGLSNSTLSLVDVFVEMPGATPADVEQRVRRPMEPLLWEVPGVEYVYLGFGSRTVDGRRPGARPNPPRWLTGTCRPTVLRRMMAPDPVKLQSGARIGSYEGIDTLGRGGMGEVYRARDTRLNRDVAIKGFGGWVSPNGRWLAYLSEEAGRLDLYVQSFPDAGAKVQVSDDAVQDGWWFAGWASVAVPETGPYAVARRGRSRGLGTAHWPARQDRRVSLQPRGHGRHVGRASARARP